MAKWKEWEEKGHAIAERTFNDYVREVSWLQSGRRVCADLLISWKGDLPSKKCVLTTGKPSWSLIRLSFRNFIWYKLILSVGTPH